MEVNKVWAEEHLKARLSLWQRIVLKINGCVFVGYGKREGWSGELPFYIVKCGRCKQYFLDYLHGYSGYFLCPECDLTKGVIKR
jgi:hypothetical protein